jgi:hypothetical protein
VSSAELALPSRQQLVDTKAAAQAGPARCCGPRALPASSPSASTAAHPPTHPPCPLSLPVPSPTNPEH